jgi:hypothetical protein
MSPIKKITKVKKNIIEKNQAIPNCQHCDSKEISTVFYLHKSTWAVKKVHSITVLPITSTVFDFLSLLCTTFKVLRQVFFLSKTCFGALFYLAFCKFLNLGKKIKEKS